MIKPMKKKRSVRAIIREVLKEHEGDPRLDSMNFILKECWKKEGITELDNITEGAPSTTILRAIASVKKENKDIKKG